MSLTHYTCVGHFDVRKVFSRNLEVAKPIDPAKVMRLLAEYTLGMADLITFQDGYVRCQWAPAFGLEDEVAEFAYRLAREEGCLAVENGLQVLFPPEATRVQGEMYERLWGEAGLAERWEKESREQAARFGRRRT